MARHAADRAAPALTVEADLHLDVSVAGRRTAATLTGRGGTLTLDVADPVVALRALPGRDALGGGAGRAALRPLGLLHGHAVTLTSAGRPLGVLRVGSAGALRYRPTPAGLVVVARAVGSAVPVRRLLAVTAAVVGAGVAVRRSLASPRWKRGAGRP